MDSTILLSILTAVGFGSILTAIIQYALEKKRRTSEILFDARKKAYAKVLRELRIRSGEHETADIHGIMSEATLLAGSELREKLVQAANAFPDHWEIIYGSDKATALKDIEEAMKEELGIR